jgi:hypothetical protein
VDQAGQGGQRLLGLHRAAVHRAGGAGGTGYQSASSQLQKPGARCMHLCEARGKLAIHFSSIILLLTQSKACRALDGGSYWDGHKPSRQNRPTDSTLR